MKGIFKINIESGRPSYNGFLFVIPVGGRHVNKGILRKEAAPLRKVFLKFTLRAAALLSMVYHQEDIRAAAPLNVVIFLRAAAGGWTVPRGVMAGRLDRN